MLVPVDLDACGGCVRAVTMAFVAGTEPKEALRPRGGYASRSVSPPAARAARRLHRPPQPPPARRHARAPAGRRRRAPRTASASGQLAPVAQG